MSVSSKKKRKERKSQLPVALVYFATLLLFLAVFGLIGSFVIDKIDEMKNPKLDTTADAVPSFNLLMAHVNGKDVLAEMAVLRVSPEKNTVVVMPVSSFTKKEGTEKTLREVYDEGGIGNLKNAVEETLVLKIDNYASVSNTAYERLVDMIGGFIYTPKEDLYYISKVDGYDISIRSGQAISLVGRQVRLISQYPVFEAGKEGNLQFMGEALEQLVTNALRQTSITRNNLDNIYNIITKDSDTDWDKNVFKVHKTYIRKMLDTNETTCQCLIPTGTWAEDKLEVSDSFREQLASVIKDTEPAEKKD